MVDLRYTFVTWREVKSRGNGHLELSTCRESDPQGPVTRVSEQLAMDDPSALSRNERSAHRGLPGSFLSRSQERPNKRPLPQSRHSEEGGFPTNLPQALETQGSVLDSSGRQRWEGPNHLPRALTVNRERFDPSICVYSWEENVIKFY